MKTIAIAIVCMALQGCATMFDRSPRRVLVASTPPGADVYVGGARVGRTPTAIDPTSEDVTVEMSGRTELVRLSPEASPWLWADIPAAIGTGFLGFGLGHRLCDECDLRPKMVPAVFTSLVPIIVDLVSGRAFRYPSRIHVSLAPTGSRSLNAPVDPVRFPSSELGQPRAQQSLRPMQPHPGVARGGVEPRRGRGGRAVLDVAHPRHFAEGRRNVVDGGEEEPP